MQPQIKNEMLQWVTLVLQSGEYLNGVLVGNVTIEWNKSDMAAFMDWMGKLIGGIRDAVRMDGSGFYGYCIGTMEATLLFLDHYGFIMAILDGNNYYLEIFYW